MNQQMKELLIAATIACLLAIFLPGGCAWAFSSTGLEHPTHNREVVGSSPTRPTNSEARLTSDSISKLWVTVPITSWHKEDKNYNERNWGLGLEYDVSPSWSFVGGTYRNSFYKQSYYAGGVWTPLKFEIQEVTIKGGFLLGFFSGYENKVMFLTPPVIQVEAFKKWGGDLVIGDGFVGFSLKFNKGILE